MKVAIVGAGPVGLTGAHLLSRLGVEVTLLERTPKPSVHPSAHFLQSRTMEILREVGLAQLILDDTPSSDEWRHFLYCNSVTGKVYRRHDHLSTPEYTQLMSLTDLPPVHFPQHKLVDLLTSTLPPAVKLLRGRECVKVVQGRSVQAYCQTGEVIEADYLIGCDGARSSVRRHVGIPTEGGAVLQSFLNIHFTSRRLSAQISSRPAMIYQVYNKEIIAFVVMHNLAEGEFVMQVPCFPSLQKTDLSPAEIRALVDAAAGQSLSDLAVHSVRVWKMAGRSARALRCDRVFLAGDAAHEFPPAGGFGLNTGIGDIHNLYWKLFYPQLLNTYAVERMPYIQEIIQSSLRNYQRTVNTAKNFGLNLTYANALKQVAEWVPFGSSLFQTGMAWGQQWLFTDSVATQYLSNDEHLLGLIYPKEDLLYTYSDGFCQGESKLAPHMEVVYNSQSLPLRQVPAVIAQDAGSPQMVYLKGKVPLEYPNLPTTILEYPGHHSYLIRPDSHIHSTAC